ncbi:MAG: sulfatase [Cyclobacteriaceae bacterium]|nr:sulfatase [Cyclobacteriaceae bacterium]
MKISYQFLIAFIWFLTSNHLLTAQKQSQPNILWITCEDISPTLSFYGDSTASTPTLDKLAAESLIYTNAFATVGVCAPSRSSIITGMYPISIGTHNMRTGRDYYSWGLRKYDLPSNAKDIKGNKVPLYSVVTPPEIKCFTEYLREAGYYCTNNAKTDYQFAAPVSAWDANNDKAHWKNRAEGQPFFAVFNLDITHESRIWLNKELPLTVDKETVPLPPYYPDNPVVRQDVARNYSNIELLDKQVANLIKEIEEAGLLDNTIIFFYSDHGGPLPRGKREHYDSGLKVPFLVRFPHNKTARQTDELISFVDLAPTVLSLAGIQVPDYMQGRAFLGTHKKAGTARNYVFGSGDRFDDYSDRIRTVRDKNYLYVKNYYPELPAYKDVTYRKNIDMMNTLLSLRDEGSLNGPTARWFKPHKPAEELYDVNADPYNMHNIINDSAYANKRKEMQMALKNWLTTVGDKGAEVELDLLYKMWPEGVQPITNSPTLKYTENKITASTSTEGASLVYIVSKKPLNPDLNASWQLYQNPVKLSQGERVYFMAARIGFADSKIVEYIK